MNTALAFSFFVFFFSFVSFPFLLFVCLFVCNVFKILVTQGLQHLVTFQTDTLTLILIIIEPIIIFLILQSVPTGGNE